jgi:hypothetical protein
MAWSFGVVALISLTSVAIFWRLEPDAGAEVSGRRAAMPQAAAAAAE